MKQSLSAFVLLIFLSMAGVAQNIGFNDNNSDPDASAMVDVYSANKGMLVPRVSLDSTLLAAPVTNPATSLLVYNSATIHDVIPGYYFWNGSLWARLESSADQELNYTVATKTSSTTLLKTETLVLASGNTTLTLPAITLADDGLEIVIKNAGNYTDLVIVQPQAGHTIDASNNCRLTRWNGKTFLAIGSNWVIKNNESRDENLLDVSSTGSFTSISEVVQFLNMHMNAPTVVRLGGGIFPVYSTQTIDLPFPVTFEGLSFGESIIECPDGDTAFNCFSECYFKMLTFNGGDIPSVGINLRGGGNYYEIKDGYFYGLTKGIIVSDSVNFWLFEVDFDSCLTAGVEIDAGSTRNVTFKGSECDYNNCAIAIHLKSAGPKSDVSIMNGTFYNTSSGQTGIVYVPSTGSNNFRFRTMIITNDSYNSTGNFISGFDFTRSDGRDAGIFMENNAGIESKAPHCKIIVANSTAETTISYSNNWYKAASFTSYNSYTVNWTIANNRITYQPVNHRDAISFISGNIRCNATQARNINIAIVKNGNSAVRYGETTVRIPSNNQNQSYQFSTNVYMIDVMKNDYFEIWLSSSNSGDLLVIDDLNWYTDSH
jgi:hypothetical protein